MLVFLFPIVQITTSQQRFACLVGKNLALLVAQSRTDRGPDRYTAFAISRHGQVQALYRLVG